MMDATDGQTWPASSLTFPLARVKKIIKADREVGTIQNEALLVAAAAAVWS